ncbi:MAG TPA: DNA adenine methylase [Pirellulales bacterium]|jgi:DNA adenine methylase|nr:DNA adenine methylase [Pirellulales bacterium]
MAMLHYTPLRYPGGKRRLAGVVVRLLELNGLQDTQYVEPYAGGAAVAIGLLFEEYASVVHLNDLSRPVFAFWHTVLNKTEWLCNRIRTAKITMPAWRRHREVYRRRESAELHELGFSALFLNRTNRSGIIRGGVIGGKDQAGDWTLGVRFNRSELIERIKKIGRYKERINLYQMDALEFTNKVIPGIGGNSFIFFDPPYIERSQLLYMNDYSIQDHHDLQARILRMKQPWIVTYDYAAITQKLYPLCRRIVYGLHYTAHEKYEGQEVMYFSDRLILPKTSELLAPRMKLVPYRSRLKART